jgi:hypothetical protein
MSTWTLSQVLPWMCLLVVVSTTAYGPRLAAESTVPPRAADQLDRSSHDAWEQRGVLLQAASSSSSRMVLITGRDATTGDRMQLECRTTTDRYAEDALLVELKDLLHVAAQLCNAGNARVVRP